MTARKLIELIYLRLCGNADPATMVADVIQMIDDWRAGIQTLPPIPPGPPGPNAGGDAGGAQ